MPPDSVLQISLLSAPSTRFDDRHKGPHFAVLPLGLENLTAALSTPSQDSNRIYKDQFPSYRSLYRQRDRTTTTKRLPLSLSIQKGNETASEKLRWVVKIKHDPKEEQLFSLFDYLLLLITYLKLYSCTHCYL